MSKYFSAFLLFSYSVYAISGSVLKENSINNAPNGLQHIGDKVFIKINNFSSPSASTQKIKKSIKNSHIKGQPYKGELIYQDGSTYNGILLNGKKHGLGIYQSVDGYTYDGAWKNDKKHGYGTLTKRNGAIYKGKWANDMRNGKGLQLFTDDVRANGAEYNGNWVDDKMSGKGVFNDGKGLVYDGEWINDKFSGYGVFKYLDELVQEGEFDDSYSRGVLNEKGGNQYWGCFKNFTILDGYSVESGVNYLYKAGQKNNIPPNIKIPTDLIKACPNWKRGMP